MTIDTIDKELSKKLLKAYNEKRFISAEERRTGKTTSAVELARAISLYEESSVKIVVPHVYMASAFNKMFDSPLHGNMFIAFCEVESVVLHSDFTKIRIIVDELTIRQVSKLSLNPNVEILTGFISLEI